MADESPSELKLPLVRAHLIELVLVLNDDCWGPGGSVSVHGEVTHCTSGVNGAACNDKQSTMWVCWIVPKKTERGFQKSSAPL